MEKHKSTRGGLLLTGCIILGMGIGFLTHRLVPGMFIGTGVGFILFALIGMKQDK